MGRRFWPYKPFSKLKPTFCKYWLSTKIEISVYRVYIKLNKDWTVAMITAKNDFFVGLTWKLLFSGGMTLW